MTLFLALILSVVATWIWIRVARRLRLLDAPNPLVPQHRAPTAHMGGVAVASSAIIALALSSGGRGSDDGVVIAVLVGGVGFLLLGVMDDLLRLSARWKFAGQLVVASAAVVGGVVHPFFAIPWLDGAIAVLLIVTVVNAVNLTDVCDGLVAGLIAVTLGIASLQHPTLQGWAMATSGACLGFLVFNAPPARVFLGDAGSHWLGFMLIAVALTMSSQGTPLLEATRIALLCGVFLFELTLLVVARSARGVPFWLGSQDHFSLRLQALGLSRWATVALAWSVAAVLTSLAIVLARMSGAAQVWTLATLVLVAAVAFMALLKSWSPPPAPASSRPEPPRLVWIHQNFVTARQAGNSRAVHLVAAMLERGWNVDVVTTQTGYLDEASDEEQPSMRVEREGRLTIHRLRSRVGPERRAWSWIRFGVTTFVYLAHFRRVDVVYASTPPLPQVVLAAILSLSRRAPLVLEVRDLWPLFLDRLGLLRSSLTRTVMEWMEAFIHRAARHGVAVSPAFVPYLLDMGIRECTVAPTGVHAPNVAAEPVRTWRREHGLEDAFVVVYAGSFNESYEIGRLLEAASSDPDGRVHWVFAGGGRGRQMVEETAARHRHIHYLGTLGKDRLWPLLETADLGIVSLGANSVLELVVPGKLFDYCAARLPVLCTVNGMAGAIVRASGAGWVIANPSAEALRQAVRGVADMEESARREFGRRGFEWMSAHMSSARSARAIAIAVEEARRRFPARSQLTHLVKAACGAWADVATRRSRRAGDVLLSPGLATRCETSLAAWLEGSRVTMVDEPPLEIPVLLAERPIPS